MYSHAANKNVEKKQKKMPFDTDSIQIKYVLNSKSILGNDGKFNLQISIISAKSLIY